MRVICLPNSIYLVLQVRCFTYQQSKLKTIASLVNLRSLVLQEEVLEAPTLIEIATNCTKIERFCMKIMTKWYFIKVHPDWQLETQIRNLKIKMNRAFMIFFQNLGTQLKHLEFYLFEDPELFDVYEDDEINMGYFEHLDCCKNLETFKIHPSEENLHIYIMTTKEENSLMTLKKLKNLKFVPMFNDNFIYNYDFSTIEELDFNNDDSEFTFYDLEALAERQCPNLRVLHLDNLQFGYNETRFKEMMVKVVINWPNFKVMKLPPNETLSAEYMYRILYQYGIFLKTGREAARKMLNFARTMLFITEDQEVILKRQEAENILLNELKLTEKELDELTKICWSFENAGF